MVFASFGFLSFFLPIVILLHIILPGVKAKNLMLAIASLIFYAYGEPVYIILLLISVVLNYAIGRQLNNKQKKMYLVVAVILNIGLLVVFKYTSMIIGLLNSILPLATPIKDPAIALPIGISFYTFQALSYLIDVYRGEVKPQKNFLSLLLYISFFPQLVAGPILKYHDVDAMIEDRKVTIDGIKIGIYRFSCGMGKKIIIANTMAYIVDTIFASYIDGFCTLAAWIAAFAYLMQIYFDFSGYSDMAIGLGHIFGFQFLENFNYPYISTSIQEFWRRWHISLSTWFKEYLYIPLGGNRKGSVRTMINKYIVFFATGIWHGANWTFLLWGVYHGTLQVLEQIGIIPVKKCKVKVLNHIYTILAVMIGFVIFRANTITEAFMVIGSMFGFGVSGGETYVVVSQFLSPYYILLFVVAILGSTTLPKKLYLKALGCKENKTTNKYEIVSMVGSVLILLYCFVQLAADSYNPFIYFRF